MSIVKKNNSMTKSISRILLFAVLLAATCPISAYAADDNPYSSTLDAFPTVRDSSDTMNVNWGTINTLYENGTVKENKGHISNSYGSVYENYGSIDDLLAGHVGTNYGTIDIINNTGSLGVNDDSGTVQYLGMGNAIERNDGVVQKNSGSISANYGTVSENYATVVMYDGQVANNYQNGTVTFEAYIYGGETIPAKGSVDNNEGQVIIHSGTVTIEENTGSIEINDATVTVEKNSGTITVGNNASLFCSENNSGGVITKTSESANIVCDKNDGRIVDTTVVWYKIVFVGDDEKAEIMECDFEEDGVYYTQAGGSVIFWLPPEYGCDAAEKLEWQGMTIWIVCAFPEEGDTDFTIICHKCSICDLQGHSFNEYITNNDATCTEDGTKTATCANGCGATDTITDIGSAKGHRYGEWVTTEEPTETETGTKERTCTVCNDVDTDIIPVLEHTHKGTLHKGTSATCTVAGVKDYYTCSCGKAFTDVACSVEITDLAAWKAEGGKGYIVPTGHRFDNYVSNNDATCTEDGTKTATCANGCGATDTITDIGSAKGHRYGEWVTTEEPTETETGTKERTCLACDTTETEEIPVLIPVAYNFTFGANSEWTKGNIDGLAFACDAPLDKFYSIKIDGAIIETSNYTVEFGSNKITIFPVYLENLGIGEHSIEIIFTDGTAFAYFAVIAGQSTVHKNPAEPTNPTSSQKGNNSHALLGISLLFVSSGVLAGTVVVRKKKEKRMNERLSQITE